MSEKDIRLHDNINEKVNSWVNGSINYPIYEKNRILIKDWYYQW